MHFISLFIRSCCWFCFFSDSWSALECHCKRTEFVVLLDCAHLILNAFLFSPFVPIRLIFFTYRFSVVIQADKSSIEIESVFWWILARARVEEMTLNLINEKNEWIKILMNASQSLAWVDWLHVDGNAVWSQHVYCIATATAAPANGRKWRAIKWQK